MNRIILIVLCLSFTVCIMIDKGTTIAASSMQSKMLRSSELDEQKVREMISRFGPLIYLHTDEKYLMDDPVYVLNNGVSLNFGKVESGNDYDTFQASVGRRMSTTSQTLLEDTKLVKEIIQSIDDSPNYEYWLNIDDSMKKGSMLRAKAQVRVLPFDSLTTEIQFWLFYPFNGPGKVKISILNKIGIDFGLKKNGRHYGDWELVSILVSNNAEELQGVFIACHNGNEVFKRGNDGQYRSVKDSQKILQFDGFGQDVHPIIYSAISSHAHYYNQGNHNYKQAWKKKYLLGTASADLIDRTSAGQKFLAYHKDGYRFFSSDLPNFKVQEPGWLDYDGHWGQYEKLYEEVKLGPDVEWMESEIFTLKEIGRGPSGPKMKKEWFGNGTFR